MLVWPEGASAQSRLRPESLHKGDTVGIVNISSRVSLDSARIAATLRRIESMGFGVKVARHAFDTLGGWFPAADSARATDLQQMLDDSAVKAVLFYRGGYGAVRCLDYIDWSPLLLAPKWLVGYSDLTVVHSVLARLGIESLHGQMPKGFIVDQSKCDTSALMLFEALCGRVEQYRLPPDSLNCTGAATGRLVGGNLSIICSLNGTDADLDMDSPSILFVEDVGESISSLDRMMQTLLRSGKLSRVQAIVVGHMTDITQQTAWGATARELMASYARELGIPAVINFPAGHELPNMPLYMGREVRLEVTNDGTTLEFLPDEPRNVAASDKGI